MATESGGGPPAQPRYAADTWVYVTSNVAWTGTSQDVTGLTFTVQAGKVASFECWIDTDPGGQSPRWSWGAGGNGATIHWEALGCASGTVRSTVVDMTTFGNTGNVGVFAGRRWIRMMGVVIGGTGSVTLQLTQTSGVSVTATVYAGSWLRYRTLG